jgi:teichuronic acid biosynthesis glycosyltransferase TuaG
MNSDLVSIITPLYNAGLFIAEAYKSVVNQTYTNWEWIIVDDRSTDNSFEIINKLAENESRIIISQNPVNSGSGVTRNKAIEIAKGSIIAFLDSDDTWHPEKLERHVSFMNKNNAAFSHTSYGYIDESGNKIKNTFHVSAKPVSYYDLLKRTEISCLTAMYNAEKIGKFYMSEHKRKQDYALWLSILKSGVNSYGLDEELAYYRQRKGSATSAKYKLILKHFSFLKETQQMNYAQAAYYTSYWLINGFVRYYIK